MEQLNDKWVRFPIDLSWQRDLDLGIESDKFEGFYDARLDSIVGWRPEYTEDKGICGTFIYFTSGDCIVAKIKPATLNNLLNYEPIKLKADEF